MDKPPIYFNNGTFHVKVKDILNSPRGKDLILKMYQLDLVNKTK